MSHVSAGAAPAPASSSASPAPSARPDAPARLGPLGALREHWREYLIEAAALGIFMISACLCTALFEYPGSPVHAAMPNAVLRRILIGVAMGVTAVALIYSPWGQRSGAHMNPAVTLTFFRLRKVPRWDAVFYVAFQFLGGVAGVLLCAALFSKAMADQSVNYIVTLPGAPGVWFAFACEFAISCALMLTVLYVSNTVRFARFTGWFAGALVALYIAIEAPYSGMSMNPARTFGSAAVARNYSAMWLYFVAPVLGMLLAAELYTRWRGVATSVCAKLHHAPGHRCIFHCGYDMFKAGDVIMREGEPGDIAYIVEEGDVEVRKRDERSGDVVLARLGRHQLVGEMALLLDQPRTATVVALTDVRARRFTRENFANVIAQDSKLSIQMLSQLAARVADADRRLAEANAK